MAKTVLLFTSPRSILGTIPAYRSIIAMVQGAQNTVHLLLAFSPQGTFNLSARRQTVVSFRW